MKKQKAKTNIIDCQNQYNVVITKSIKPYKKGDILLIGLDIKQLSQFLGKNNYPIGFCGNCGDVNFTFSKEVMNNIIIEKELITVTTITEFCDLKNFK
jgi:hypothetical protein